MKRKTKEAIILPLATVLCFGGIWAMFCNPVIGLLCFVSSLTLTVLI